eukprot:SAG31_NODE_2172_length_6259_cov_2.500162_2_plen_106_part_00
MKRVGNGEPLADSPPRGLVPQRLVESPDPEIARMHSVWSPTQKEWMSKGYDPEFVSPLKAAWYAFSKNFPISSDLGDRSTAAMLAHDSLLLRQGRALIQITALFS